MAGVPALVVDVALEDAPARGADSQHVHLVVALPGGLEYRRCAVDVEHAGHADDPACEFIGTHNPHSFN